MSKRAIIGISLLMLVALTAHAQNPPKPQDDEDVIKVKSNLVNIDVIVKDKKGKYVSDLKPEDFTITENGVAQKIDFFDAPLSRTDAGKPGDQVATTTAPRGAWGASGSANTTLGSSRRKVTGLRVFWAMARVNSACRRRGTPVPVPCCRRFRTR